MAHIFVLSAALAGSLACPFFSEMHADPKTMADAQGEYFEIYVPPHGGDSLQLTVQKQTLGYDLAPSATPQRLVFCHQDTLHILPNFPVACLHWPGNLPNSVEISAQLSFGYCNDSTTIPKAKAGKSHLRTAPSSPWITGDPTPGFPDLQESQWGDNRTPTLQVSADPPWELSAPVQQGDSLYWEALALDGQKLGQGVWWRDTTMTLATHWPLQIQVKLRLVGDQFPLDNTLDTIIFPQDAPPLRLTEVVPCPADDQNEWWELVNQTLVPIAAQRISICTGPADSSKLTVAPLGFAVMTNDTALFQEEWGYNLEITMLNTPQKRRLRNTSDTLRLCLDRTEVHRVTWQIASGKCAAAYRVEDSLLVGRPQMSPGFEILPRAGQQHLRLSAQRVRSGQTLELRAPPDLAPWQIAFYDSQGVLLLRTHSPDAHFTITLPRVPRGPFYLIAQDAEGQKTQYLLYGVQP